MSKIAEIRANGGKIRLDESGNLKAKNVAAYREWLEENKRYVVETLRAEARGERLYTDSPIFVLIDNVYCACKEMRFDDAAKMIRDADERLSDDYQKGLIYTASLEKEFWNRCGYLEGARLYEAAQNEIANQTMNLEALA